MPLMIRLRKQGRTNRQTFRLVVTDGRNPRDGKYIENLGYFLPCEKENRMKVNEERVTYWLSQGAQMSENAKSFIGKAAPSVVKSHNEKVHAKRQKECAKKRALRKKNRDNVATPPTEKDAASEAAEKVSAPKKGTPAMKAVKKAVKKTPAKAKKAEDKE